MTSTSHGNTRTGSAWSADIDAPDKYGFFKFNNIAVHTLSERDFEDILTHEDKWAKLTERMDDDFKDALDMFPFEDSSGVYDPHDGNWIETSSARIGDLLKGLARGLGLTRIDLPRRFYAINKALIEKRFPGGRQAGDPGDGDIRDMISDFRILFKRNFAGYISTKRRFQFTVALAYIASVLSILLLRGWIGGQVAAGVTMAGKGLNVTFAAPVAPVIAAGLMLGLFALAYMAIFYFYRMFSYNVFHAYKNAQTESCKTLDKHAALRTKNLSNLISTLTPRIDKDLAVLVSTRRAAEWPERSRKWVLLVYWLGQRQEYIERFAQLEIWLIRRAHYFYGIIGTVCNAATLLLSLGLLAAAVAVDAVMVNGHPGFSLIVDATGFVSAAWVILSVSRISAKEWNTDLDLIQSHLDISNWDRFHSVRLHDRMANQVFSDKQYILQREDWVAGKNR